MTKHYTHDEIEAMLDAATPGEWSVLEVDEFIHEIYSKEAKGPVITPGNHEDLLVDSADLALIIHGAAIIRQLLEENKAMPAGLITPTKAPPHQRHEAKMPPF